MATHKRKRRRKKRYHTGVHISTKTGQACKYRSGWEQKYMVWLDSEPTVATYGYEVVKVPYVSNRKTGKLRTYNPDFLVTYLDGHQELIEIKPKRKVPQACNQKKLKAGEEWSRAHGIVFLVITESELIGLGLL